MSGDSGGGSSHPARKIEQGELKRFLARTAEDTPALTTKLVALQFPHVDPQTVRGNLHTLADNEEICRLSDGDKLLWWFPRETDQEGDITYEDIVDDSVDYDEIVPEDVPQDIAEKIATERLPYYRPQSAWSVAANICQLGIIGSVGMIILGFGGIISNSFWLQRNSAEIVLKLGFYAAFVITVAYLAFTILDILAQRGHITRDPVPQIRRMINPAQEQA